MTRRLTLFVLIPVLLGAMVGVGLVTARLADPAPATLAFDPAPEATPTPTPSSTTTEPPGEPSDAPEPSGGGPAAPTETSAPAPNGQSTDGPFPRAQPTDPPDAADDVDGSVDVASRPERDQADRPDDAGADSSREQRAERRERQERKKRQERAEVTAYQEILAEHGYYFGAIDGIDGPATTSAVVAFQKVHGLVADGVVGPVTREALRDPAVPQLQGGPDHRVEVDLARQVLFYVEDGELERIMPVSSGSGESYTTASGGTARSLTPVGTFTIQRHIRGVRNAPLGTLYDPLYFYEGWAIHGSDSVPAWPASHGCVRVSRADAVWLFDRAPIGTTVVLYGGEHTFVPGSGAAGTDTPAGDV